MAPPTGFTARYVKALQRRLLDLLWTRAGVALVALTLACTALAGAGVVWGAWSLLPSPLRREEEVSSSLCSLSRDNIGGQAFLGRLCSGPIDVVYTWVNGSDPAWFRLMSQWKAREAQLQGADGAGGRGGNHPNASSSGAEYDVAGLNRYRDNDELRFSFRSIEKYAPWVRRIHLVTNGQVPAWLDTSHPRVSVVTHDQIFANLSHLPVFSSPAIEMHLHRIPGLAPQFIYFNDDVLLFSDAWPDDFITGAQGPKVYLSWEVPPCSPGCVNSWWRDGYCDSACNTSRCQWDGGDCLNATKQPNGGKSGSNSRTRYSAYTAGPASGGDTAGAAAAAAAANDATFAAAAAAMSSEPCNTGCPDTWIGDKTCDAKCTTLACGWDGGDCAMERVWEAVAGFAPSLPMRSAPIHAAVSAAAAANEGGGSVGGLAGGDRSMGSAGVLGSFLLELTDPGDGSPHDDAAALASPSAAGGTGPAGGDAALSDAATAGIPASLAAVSVAPLRWDGDPVPWLRLGTAGAGPCQRNDSSAGASNAARPPTGDTGNDSSGDVPDVSCGGAGNGSDIGVVAGEGANRTWGPAVEACVALLNPSDGYPVLRSVSSGVGGGRESDARVEQARLRAQAARLGSEAAALVTEASQPDAAGGASSDALRTGLLSHAASLRSEAAALSLRASRAALVSQAVASLAASHLVADPQLVDVGDRERQPSAGQSLYLNFTGLLDAAGAATSVEFAELVALAGALGSRASAFCGGAAPGIAAGLLAAAEAEEAARRLAARSGAASQQHPPSLLRVNGSDAPPAARGAPEGGEGRGQARTVDCFPLRGAALAASVSGSGPASSNSSSLGGPSNHTHATLGGEAPSSPPQCIPYGALRRALLLAAVERTLAVGGSGAQGTEVGTVENRGSGADPKSGCPGAPHCPIAAAATAAVVTEQLSLAAASAAAVRDAEAFFSLRRTIAEEAAARPFNGSDPPALAFFKRKQAADAGGPGATAPAPLPPPHLNISVEITSAGFEPFPGVRLGALSLVRNTLVLLLRAEVWHAITPQLLLVVNDTCLGLADGTGGAGGADSPLWNNGTGMQDSGGSGNGSAPGDSGLLATSQRQQQQQHQLLRGHGAGQLSAPLGSEPASPVEEDRGTGGRGSALSNGSGSTVSGGPLACPQPWLNLGEGGQLVAQLLSGGTMVPTNWSSLLSAVDLVAIHVVLGIRVSVHVVTYTQEEEEEEQHATAAAAVVAAAAAEERRRAHNASGNAVPAPLRQQQTLLFRADRQVAVPLTFASAPRLQNVSLRELIANGTLLVPGGHSGGGRCTSAPHCSCCRSHPLHLNETGARSDATSVEAGAGDGSIATTQTTLLNCLRAFGGGGGEATAGGGNASSAPPPSAADLCSACCSPEEERALREQEGAGDDGDEETAPPPVKMVDGIAWPPIRIHRPVKADAAAAQGRAAANVSDAAGAADESNAPDQQPRRLLAAHPTRSPGASQGGEEHDEHLSAAAAAAAAARGSVPLPRNAPTPVPIRLLTGLFPGPSGGAAAGAGGLPSMLSMAQSQSRRRPGMLPMLGPGAAGRRDGLLALRQALLLTPQTPGRFRRHAPQPQQQQEASEQAGSAPGARALSGGAGSGVVNGARSDHIGGVWGGAAGEESSDFPIAQLVGGAWRRLVHASASSASRGVDATSASSGSEPARAARGSPLEREEGLGAVSADITWEGPWAPYYAAAAEAVDAAADADGGRGDLLTDEGAMPAAPQLAPLHPRRLSGGSAPAASSGGSYEKADTYADSLIATNRLFNVAFSKKVRKVPAHMPHFITTSLMERVAERWAPQFAATSSHRFRSSEDLQYAFLYFHTIMEGGVRAGLDMDAYWARELDTDGDGMLGDNELRTLAAVVFQHSPVAEGDLGALRACLTPGSGASTSSSRSEPLPGGGAVRVTEVRVVSLPITIDALMACPLAVEGLAKNARFPVTHQEAPNLNEVAFEMITDDLNKTQSQLDSVRGRKPKFVCINDDMREAPAPLRSLLAEFFTSAFPRSSSFELPDSHLNPVLYIGPLRELRRREAEGRAAAIAAACLLVAVLLERALWAAKAWRAAAAESGGAGGAPSAAAVAIAGAPLRTTRRRSASRSL